MKLKFLIVDDSMAMRTIVKRVLMDAGYTDHEFKFAENGKQALDHIINWRPDLVLLDLHMPEMSGIELLKRVQELKLQTKIGLVTAENDAKTLNQAKQAGVAFVVNKPFETEAIREAITGVIEGKPVDAVTVAGTLPPILFPSCGAVATLLSAITSVKCDFLKCDPLPLSQLNLPATLALLVDKQNKVQSLIILDTEATDTLAETFASSLFSQQAFDDKLLTKSLQRALSIIGTLFYNTVERSELTLMKYYSMNQIIDKIRFIDELANDSRQDMQLHIDGKQAGKILFVAQSIA